MAAKPHLTHLALGTRNMDRALDFYRRYCGLELVHDRGGSSSARVAWVGESKKRPRFVIVLIEGVLEHSAPKSLAHVGFSCASRKDVDAKAKMARDEGLLEMEPRDSGPVVGYHCVVNDPDGNAVEFSYGQAIGPDSLPKPSKSRRKVRKKR